MAIIWKSSCLGSLLSFRTIWPYGNGISTVLSVLSYKKCYNFLTFTLYWKCIASKSVVIQGALCEKCFMVASWWKFPAVVSVLVVEDFQVVQNSLLLTQSSKSDKQAKYAFRPRQSLRGSKRVWKVNIDCICWIFRAEEYWLYFISAGVSIS